MSLKTIIFLLSSPLMLIGIIAGFIGVNIRAGYYYIEDKLVE